MATTTEKSPFYRAAYFIEYNLPPESEDDVSEIRAMIDEDIAFEREIKTTPKMGNPIVARQNHFHSGVEPPEKWEWNNTEPSVRERILKSI